MAPGIIPLILFLFGTTFLTLGLFLLGKGKAEPTGWAVIWCGLLVAALSPLVVAIDENPLVAALTITFAFGAIIAGCSLIKNLDTAATGSAAIFCGIIALIYGVYFITLAHFYYLAFSCFLWAIWWWVITGFTWGKISSKIVGYLTTVESFITFLVIGVSMLLGVTLP